MLARASVETLFLGVYCLRVPEAVAKLHAGNIKALGDAMAYLEEMTSARRGDQAVRGQARRAPPTAEGLGPCRGNRQGQWQQGCTSIDRQLYVPLSNFTVHASGGTLLRHVGRNRKLARRPLRSWNRRSPARVADAAAGLLAADFAQHGQSAREAARLCEQAQEPHAHADGRHGLRRRRRSVQIRRVRETSRIAREVFTYLWHGAAAADPLDIRIEHVRERFAAMLDIGELDIPEGSLDPFIDYVADKLARLVPAGSRPRLT